ncbi:MAG TPA: LysM domain-containing protein, partial [Solimonas sp.]|nr:LysM domain-containing protein [Solimonas sp.]
ETLGSLAREYGVSQSSIRAANGLKKKAKLRLGQVLKMPPHTEARPGPITVAVGESKPKQTRSQKLAVQAEERAEQKAASKKKPAKAAKKKSRSHKVTAGQTLSSIAARYDVSVSELRAANGLGKSSVIKTGQRLKIPAK